MISAVELEAYNSNLGITNLLHTHECMIVIVLYFISGIYPGLSLDSATSRNFVSTLLAGIIFIPIIL